MKRTIAVVLGVCLLLGAFPFAVAEGEPEGNIIAEVETLAELKEAVAINRLWGLCISRHALKFVCHTPNQ